MRTGAVSLEHVIVDTREQRPLWETPPAQSGTLNAGDYSLAGYESVMAVERKSVADLYGSIGSGRERFLRSLRRLSRLPVRAVVIEGSMDDVLRYANPGKLTAERILASIDSWSTGYDMQFWFCGNAEGARAMTLSRFKFGLEKLQPGYRHGDVPCACGGGLPVPHSSRCPHRPQP